MIYPNEKGVAVLGNGFLANVLKKKDLPPGVYAFSAPSSNVLFDEQLLTCTSDTIGEIVEALEYCKAHNTYLVYPSSATVYNKNTSYAKCKTIVETLVEMWGIPALGLRVSAGYGPGEAHKGRYASVIYQWCQSMRKGERPTIYGDGTQTRDFIFEDDLADTIARWANEGKTGIHDIGTGVNTSFNEVVATINSVLGATTDLNRPIEPIYVPKPQKYVQDTPVKAVSTKVSLYDGITRILSDTHR